MTNKIENRVFWIFIDNLSYDYLGCFGGRMETQFIDILASDSFVLKNHTVSSQTPEGCFFSLMSGVIKPDLSQHTDLATLIKQTFSGVCLVRQNDAKDALLGYEIDSTTCQGVMSVVIHPSNFATSSIKSIADESIGFVYHRYAIVNERQNSPGYADQIFKMDEDVGKLLAAIEEFADYNESYIILSSNCTPSPCIVKFPKSRTRQFVGHTRNIRFSTMDVDILPTIFDLEGKSHLLPEGIDGASLINNFIGKDQKLRAERAK